MKSNSASFFSSRAVIVIVLVFIFLWILSSRGSFGRGGSQKDTACTMDAKICPDGSAVGRMPPSCEFAACPSGEISPTPIADVIYRCDKGKLIHAVYTNLSVSLELSGGRNLTLPQTISGSGARYANSDESVVFWNKGNTAFIEEGQDLTYTNCIEAK